MYLTRFRMNVARQGARRLLGSPHLLHGAVRAAFATPEAHTQGSARTLWRVDHAAPSTMHLYLTSPGEPELTHLVEQAGWPTTDTWDTRDYTSVLSSLENGQRWAFRLTANPVHSGRKDAESKETQRFGYIREHEQIDWLLRAATTRGFTIANQANGEPNVTLRQQQKLTFARGNGRVTLLTATFDGVLVISDHDRFRQALIGGIGHGKAYGCGLLTLAPVR